MNVEFLSDLHRHGPLPEKANSVKEAVLIELFSYRGVLLSTMLEVVGRKEAKRSATQSPGCEVHPLRSDRR